MVTTYSSISLVFNDAEEYPSFTTKTGGFEQVNMGTVSNKTADFVHNDSTVSYIYIYIQYTFFLSQNNRMMIKHKEVSLKALEYVGIFRRMFLVEA